MDNFIPISCLECKKEVESSPLVPEVLLKLNLPFCDQCWMTFPHEDTLSDSIISVEDKSMDFRDMIEGPVIEPTQCQEHKKQTKLLCLQEKHMVCEKCVFSGSHKGHDVIDFEEALEEQEKKTTEISYLRKLIQTYAWKIIENKEESQKKRKEELLKEVNEKFNNFVEVIINKKNKVIGEIMTFYKNMGNSLMANSPQLSELIGWKEKMTSKIRKQGLKIIPKELNKFQLSSLDLLEEDTQLIADRFKKLIQYDFQRSSAQTKTIEITWGNADNLEKSLCALTLNSQPTQFADPHSVVEIPTSSTLSDQDRKLLDTLLNSCLVHSVGDSLNVDLLYIITNEQLKQNRGNYAAVERWLQLKENQLTVSLDVTRYDSDLDSCISKLLSKSSLSELHIDLKPKNSWNTTSRKWCDSIKNSIRYLENLSKFSAKLINNQSCDFNIELNNIISKSPDLMAIDLEFNVDPPRGRTIYVFPAWYMKLVALNNLEKISLSTMDSQVITAFKSLKKYKSQHNCKSNELNSLLECFQQATNIQTIQISLFEFDFQSVTHFLDGLARIISLQKVTIRLPYLPVPASVPQLIRKLSIYDTQVPEISNLITNPLRDIQEKYQFKLNYLL